MNKKLQIQISWISKTCNKMADDREKLKTIALFVLEHIKRTKKYDFMGYKIDTVEDQVQRQIAFLNFKLDYFKNTDEVFISTIEREVSKSIKDAYGYSLDVRGYVKVC